LNEIGPILRLRSVGGTLVVRTTTTAPPWSSCRLDSWHFDGILLEVIKTIVSRWYWSGRQ
jgi:hypothetical protein